METQAEPLIQSWIKLSAENFWEFLIQARDFLNANVEEIAFWCAASVVALLGCLALVLLVYHQRSYLYLWS